MNLDGYEKRVLRAFFRVSAVFFSYFNANQFDEYDVIYNLYVNLLQTH